MYLSSRLFSGPVRCLYLRIYRSNLWERNHSDVNIWISYNRNLAGKNYFFYTTMRKNTYILQTIQDELTLSSDMKSTLNFGLAKCIYKRYLNFDIFHHSPTLASSPSDTLERSIFFPYQQNKGVSNRLHHTFITYFSSIIFY